MAVGKSWILIASLALVGCAGDDNGGGQFGSGTDPGPGEATSMGGGQTTTAATDTDAPGTDGGTAVAEDDTAGDDNGDDNGAGEGSVFDVGMIPEPPTGDGCTKVDFLFVIDTSGSMSQEQEALRLAYPAFIQGIEATGISDYHVAVTTADMGSCSITTGDNGEFSWQPAIDDPGCYPLPLRYIEGPSSASTAEFQCIAEIFGGSGTEQPFQGGYSALVDRIQDGTNPAGVPPPRRPAGGHVHHRRRRPVAAERRGGVHR